MTDCSVPMVGLVGWEKAVFLRSICAMVKPVAFFGGWEVSPTFNDGILIMGPYKPLRNWVDDHPLLYGNHESLDPGTFGEKWYTPEV